MASGLNLLIRIPNSEAKTWVQTLNGATSVFICNKRKLLYFISSALICIYLYLYWTFYHICCVQYVWFTSFKVQSNWDTVMYSCIYMSCTLHKAILKEWNITLWKRLETVKCMKIMYKYKANITYDGV